jgi:hypothetical protein
MTAFLMGDDKKVNFLILLSLIFLSLIFLSSEIACLAKHAPRIDSERLERL